MPAAWPCCGLRGSASAPHWASASSCAKWGRDLPPFPAPQRLRRECLTLLEARSSKSGCQQGGTSSEGPRVGPVPASTLTPGTSGVSCWAMQPWALRLHLILPLPLSGFVSKSSSLEGHRSCWIRAARWPHVNSVTSIKTLISSKVTFSGTGSWGSNTVQHTLVCTRAGRRRARGTLAHRWRCSRNEIPNEVGSCQVMQLPRLESRALRVGGHHTDSPTQGVAAQQRPSSED